jgi:membrane associated rhomboid family serine protease
VDRPSRAEIERTVQAAILGLFVGLVLVLLDRRRADRGS